MAVRRDTLRALQALHLQLDRHVDAVTGDLTIAWARAWSIATAEWYDAALALATTRDDGRWPTRVQIRREERAQRALAVTRSLLDTLSARTGVLINYGTDATVRDTIAGSPDVATTQLPVHARDDWAGLLNEVNARQVQAIVERTARQVTAVTRPLSTDATAAVYDQLVRGVLVGDNPNVAARAMVEQVRGAFDGGLVRAKVIARTEMLDAYRAGGGAWQHANSAVLRGWQWVAQLDRRTCPSCWSQHGSEHPVDDPGPLDHQQGRCARVPLTRSWEDLGFAIKEPPSLIPDAQATFAGLSQADQLTVMGPTRLELLQSGDVSWDQLSVRRETSGWRDSYAPAPVSDLVPVAATA